MKKGILLTSLTLMSVVTLAGCSCGKKDGTYSFSYVEFAEDGLTKQSNCEDPKTTREIQYCEIVKENYFDSITYTLEKNKLIINSELMEEPIEMYYKIKNNQIWVSDKEDGEYNASDNAFFKDKKIEFTYDYYTIVFEK